MNTSTRRLACLVSLLGGGCIVPLGLAPPLYKPVGELSRLPLAELPRMPEPAAAQPAEEPVVEAEAPAAADPIPIPAAPPVAARDEELQRRLVLAIQRMAPEETVEREPAAPMPVREKTLSGQVSHILTRSDPARPNTTDVEAEGLPVAEELEAVGMNPRRIAAMLGFDPSAERPRPAPPEEPETQERRKVSLAGSMHPVAPPAAWDLNPAPAPELQAGPPAIPNAPEPRHASLPPAPADPVLARLRDGVPRLDPTVPAPPAVNRLLAAPLPGHGSTPPIAQVALPLACGREGEELPSRKPDEAPCRPTANEAPRPPGSPRQALGETRLALNGRSLDAIRGGFSGPNGLQVSFGIERSVYINGALVTTTSLNLNGQGQATGAAGQSLALIQSGAGNSVAPQLLLPSAMPGTVIQNSLNDQRIQALTVINATVNSMQMLRSLNLQTTIREGVTDSLRR